MDDLTSLLSTVKAVAPPQALQMWLTTAEKPQPEIFRKVEGAN